jgi:hypothetical protein
VSRCVGWHKRSARGGDAQVWTARSELPEQDARLVAAFVAQAERDYQIVLRALDAPTRSHAELARIYRQTRAVDYFHAPSGELVRARLEGRDGATGGGSA